MRRELYEVFNTKARPPGTPAGGLW